MILNYDAQKSGAFFLGNAESCFLIELGLVGESNHIS